MKQRIGLWLAAVVVVWPVRALAEPGVDPSATPTPYYVTSLMGTTVAARPAMGTVGGAQKDLTVGLGLGRTLGRSLFVELDASDSFAGGSDAMAVVPGLGWTFHPGLYAALRAVISPMDVSVAPGLGARHALDDTISIFGELNLVAPVELAEPDVGLTVTLGATVSLSR